MSQRIQSLCVFLGSRSVATEQYREVTEDFAREMVRRNLRLVYGGATVGLMGVLADTVLAEGGEVIGVIPSCLVDLEIAHQGATVLETVDSMHARKERMALHSDAFVLLPGGFGSLEEIFEAITWNQLGIHNKPCAILNVDGYYDALLQFVERAVSDGFVRESNANSLIVDDDPLRLISTLNEYSRPAE